MPLQLKSLNDIILQLHNSSTYIQTEIKSQTKNSPIYVQNVVRLSTSERNWPI